MLLRTLIIDDELKARETLALLIKVHVPEIAEVRSAGSTQEADFVLERYTPDFVFWIFVCR